MPGHRKRRQFKQTDAFTRGMVIGLKRAGWSIRQIAADTHLGASTVHRLWRRWLEQGNVAIYRNVGATRVTSARVDRRILRQAVAAPQATCTAILQHVQDTLDHSISTRTISRRLVANGLHSCRPLRRLPLTPPNRRQRLEWCRARSTWMTEWHRVVFSDESPFCLSGDSRRVRVWRRRGERSNPAAIVERPTVRQRGIMVWGAIAYDSRSPLLRIQGTMTAQRYVDDVLRPVTLPYLQVVPNALYQQDNARPHTARISQQALQDVQMLPWPPYSPELSPIEHVWDIIRRRLHALPQPRSEDELWQMVEREWRAIPQDAIRTLIDSLPRRVAACIAVRGQIISFDAAMTSDPAELNIVQSIEVSDYLCRSWEHHSCTNTIGGPRTICINNSSGSALENWRNILRAILFGSGVWGKQVFDANGIRKLLSLHYKMLMYFSARAEVESELPLNRDGQPRENPPAPLEDVVQAAYKISFGIKGVLDRLRFLPIKKMDQRICIKFCVKNEIKCADAFRMLTVAYGEATLDRSNVYRWYKMFSEGREDVNDEERAGRPSTSTTDEKNNEVEKMILANRRITVREVAEDLNISISSCHSIFINDLGMRRVAAKFVPKLLNCDQKQHRMNIANEMLDSVRDDPNLLQRVITGDEAGVVHHEFLPQGRTVNKEYYLQVMRNLREAIRQKRPDLWKNKNWLLHHDNAPAHTSLLVRDFLAKNNTLMMPQPPYSPDLAPCDFFLFPKLKRPMKGRRYATLDEIKTASKEELKKIF
ncbi:hypothetical protein LAZ67_2003861 [Cordylochernes scorpioides]|uniref:Transposase n=1 Tax=Cordylochernes scorpioides TaxID=51811 RepID=A0ABY6K6L3_9ARAC|nr:hypothetical protein LAZ67_2003861 [Cordylochernes scorpioides]